MPTFPNPANYYLNTPESIESEVTGLNFNELAELNLDLAQSLVIEADKLSDVFEEFDTQLMSCDFDKWVQKLKTNDLISLTRWITERLAYLYHKQKMP